jgi:copper chaperone CopZ
MRLDLAITGMHCGACIRRVTAALEKVPGVQIRAVDVGSACVEYDPSQANAAIITAAVEKIGFSAAARQ